jgi:hypothetical protein
MGIIGWEMTFKLWLETEESTLVLYRGDPKQYSIHSLSKADTGALFGQGIYLTTSKRIAGDYTTKSGNAVFNYMGRKPTKRQVIDAYIRKKARFIDENGKETYYELPFPSFINDPIAIKRLGFAREKWEKMSKDHEVRINIDGTAVIRKKDSGYMVSAFRMPISIINKTLNVEESITDDIVNVLCSSLRSIGDSCKEVYEAAKEDENGYNPSFRDVYQKLDNISDPKKRNEKIGLHRN